MHVQLLEVVYHFCYPWTEADRFLNPWTFPSKNTGVGFLPLLQDLSQPRIEPASSHLLQHWQVDSLMFELPRTGEV